MSRSFTRRTWLTSHALTATAFMTRSPLSFLSALVASGGARRNVPASICAARAATHAERLDATAWQALARQAVDVARSAGARYVDARLTRTVVHNYGMADMGHFQMFEEILGVGVRALVNGYWGFAGSAMPTPAGIVRQARNAVAQAQENSKGTPRTVDLGTIPVALGTWTTPIRIDPFSVSIEEKLDNVLYWKTEAARAGVPLWMDGHTSWIQSVRQERVVATSDGACFTQTLYESAGYLDVSAQSPGGGAKIPLFAHGLDAAGKGWELFLDAHLPDQFHQLRHELDERRSGASREAPSTVGRYTLVCDGATMASLVEQTLGPATQLDRALGYEANARGTSFVTDPLGMVGALQVAAPLVTLTANRSAPAELATVKWDEEGVEPPPVTLISHGILTDFQTTREQAAWLAPYYQRQHRPVRSNGCAAAQDGHFCPIQQLPNLAFEPSTSAIGVADLVADVPHGILIEDGGAECDFQAQTGLLTGRLREITQGRLGRVLTGGAVRFETKDLWAKVATVGGPATQMLIGTSQHADPFQSDVFAATKGQPPQQTSHSVRAAAATILNQPFINPDRKA